MQITNIQYAKLVIDKVLTKSPKMTKMEEHYIYHEDMIVKINLLPSIPLVGYRVYG